MIRAVILLGVVVVLQFVLGGLVAWLAQRRNAQWVHVACVVNTVLLTCVLLTIDQFREDGLTLYSFFFTGMMVWLASAAARIGTVGIHTARANQNAQR